MSWWDRNVVEPQKLPVTLLLVAFIVTFLVTRLITRSIRAGRGPFGNVQAGGVHLHHSTPGIILLTAGAVAAVAVPASGQWRAAAAVAIGIGASLVFDEFAMILHLDDDYWTAEGRQSVQAVGLVAACLLLIAVGFAPLGVNGVGDSELGLRLGVVSAVALMAAAVLVCALKGKYRLALVALFVPPVAVAGALRLARPGSWWFRHRYGQSRAARAATRASAFDARWDPRWRRIGNIVAGAPDP
ncbi:MAG: hypothetical protein AB7V42_03105 [Thermoleophilia bacterium]